MRLLGLQPAVIALLATVAYCTTAAGETSPWFGEFLVQFPDSLLLERPSEPSRLSPPVHSAALTTPPSAGPAASGIARVSTDSAAPVPELETPASSTRSTTEAPATLTPPPAAPRNRVIFSEGPPCQSCWFWQILPDGIMYPSYVAGEKEPRMGTALLHEKDQGAVLESTIGGRLGLLRYGSAGPINPQGWQWDLEAAAMLRQNLEEELDVDATDFRIGSVITKRWGRTAVKGGMYHLSSHVGDEFLERNPNFVRRNYSRDVLLIGIHGFVTDSIAAYGEVGYSVRNDGGSEPFELQFGAEYTSLNAIDPCGAPFAAINFHLREEFDFGGAINILAGWEWRGPDSGRRFRVGGQYYTGKDMQWSFFDEDVTFAGAGIWYDF